MLKVALDAVGQVPAIRENPSISNCVQATDLFNGNDNTFEGVDWDNLFEPDDHIPEKETLVRLQNLGNGQQQVTIIPATANAREALQRRFDALQLVRRTMQQARPCIAHPPHAETTCTHALPRVYRSALVRAH